MKHTTMKHPMIAGLAVLVTSLTVQGAEPKTGPDTPAAEKTNPTGQWRSEPPADCPFKPSASLTGIEFTGRHSDYRCGDTFYPSWASDGNLYSPWTDGKTDGVVSQSGKGANAQTGHAVMIGDDPLKLEIRNTSAPKVASALPYHGRYPAGSLVYNDIWYYGTYCLGPEGSTPHNGFTWNWPNLGPMPGFQISRDFGKTWEPSPHSAGKAPLSRAGKVPRSGQDGCSAFRGFRQEHGTFPGWEGLPDRHGCGRERSQAAPLYQAWQAG